MKDECFKADVAHRMQEHELHLHRVMKMVERDEAKLPSSYPHNLLVIKKTKNPFTLVSAYAFGRGIIKSVLP